MVNCTLLVIPPWLPDYRAPFFNAVFPKLQSQGVNMIVGSAPPPPSMGARSDHHEWPWATPLETRWFKMAGRELAYRDIRPLLRSTRVDFVVVEQAIRNLETYELLARHTRRRMSVGMWGQGRSYSTPQSAPEAAAKQFLTRRCDWFFAYTQKGAEHITQRGFPSDHVSVLNNTIDTADLQHHLDSISVEDVKGFQAQHAVTPGQTALFLGGVDEAKGIPFLIESAHAIARILPGFTLLIGGAGEMSDSVITAQRLGAPIRYLGRLQGHDKALALKSSELLMIPEWVGLVAVDSLASGRPIATTDYPSHSPEFEYLTDGRNCIVTAHAITDYAEAVAGLLARPDTLARMQVNALQDSRDFTMDDMASRFTEGVRSWRMSKG